VSPARFRAVPVVPVEVEARQLTRETAEQIAQWCDAFVYTGDRHGHTSPPWSGHTCITLCEPDVMAQAGDWVVRRSDGTFEVCGPTEFETRFEPVEE
jgi:hypothetical protein